MSLLTTWGESNKVTTAGKTMRITCGPPTDPTLALKASAAGGITDVSITAWYEMTCHYTASFSYVGMDYSTATNCRDAMI